MSVDIITTVTAPASAQAPASAYDLTTLAVVHDELSLSLSDTAKDAFLSRAITEVSRTIANHCNRVFSVEGLTDLCYIRALGGGPLQLSRWPVVNLTTVATSADTPSGSVLSFASVIGIASQQPVSGLNLQPNSVVQSINGLNVTLSQPVLDDIPAGTPITFGFAAFQSLANGTTRGLVRDTDYRLDPIAGQLFRLDALTGRTIGWETWPATVSYFAGYASVPPDLEEACLALVVNRYWDRGRDPSLVEQDQPGGLGRRRWWVGGPPKSGALPEKVRGLLENYRVPVTL